MALAGEDRILSISTSDGDTRREIALQGDPQDIQFSEMKMDQRVGGESTVKNNSNGRDNILLILYIISF